MTSTPPPNTLRSTLDELERGRSEGLHLGGQLYVSVDGVVHADEAFGEAEPGVPMRPDHLMLWMSSSKPAAVVLLGKLWEAGRLELDDPVAQHLPEFGVHGKDAITIRHLLTHTGGIRTLSVGWPKEDWDATVAEIVEKKPEPRWVPGERAGYHTQSSWFVLAEILVRITGRPFAELLREEVFEPLGMNDSWIGMPTERFRAYSARIAPTWDTSKDPAVRTGRDAELAVVRPNPGGNGYGPMRELGVLYEMLLGVGTADGSLSPGRRHGVRILGSPTVAAITARHRVGMLDRTFRKTLDWGLGVIHNSAHYGEDDVPYAYGPYASANTFGHSGARSSTAFADPKHRLVVALAVNGMAGETAHRERFARLTARIYEDLGLASEDAPSPSTT